MMRTALLAATVTAARAATETHEVHASGAFGLLRRKHVNPERRLQTDYAPSAAPSESPTFETYQPTATGAQLGACETFNYPRYESAGICDVDDVGGGAACKSDDECAGGDCDSISTTVRDESGNWVSGFDWDQSTFVCDVSELDCMGAEDAWERPWDAGEFRQANYNTNYWNDGHYEENGCCVCERHCDHSRENDQGSLCVANVGSADQSDIVKNAAARLMNMDVADIENLANWNVENPSCAAEAIATSECPADSSLANCDTVAVGELCEGDGACNTSDINNCGSYDVYRRLPDSTTGSGCDVRFEFKVVYFHNPHSVSLLKQKYMLNDASLADWESALQSGVEAVTGLLVCDLDDTIYGSDCENRCAQRHGAGKGTCTTVKSGDAGWKDKYADRAVEAAGWAGVHVLSAGYDVCDPETNPNVLKTQKLELPTSKPTAPAPTRTPTPRPTSTPTITRSPTYTPTTASPSKVPTASPSKMAWWPSRRCEAMRMTARCERVEKGSSVRSSPPASYRPPPGVLVRQSAANQPPSPPSTSSHSHPFPPTSSPGARITDDRQTRCCAGLLHVPHFLLS
jgi:hypothetical protein